MVRLDGFAPSRASAVPNALIPSQLPVQQPLVLRTIGPAGRGQGSRANGSFPKGAGRLSEKSPAGYPHRSIGTTPPGSAGVPPASSPLGCRSVSLRCGSQPPCRREPHGPGRSRALAALPVDPGGGDGRGCARYRAGGTPALPGASFHDIVMPRSRYLKNIGAPLVIEGGPSVFVFIRGSSSFNDRLFFLMNDLYVGGRPLLAQIAKFEDAGNNRHNLRMECVA